MSTWPSLWQPQKHNPSVGTTPQPHSPHTLRGLLRRSFNTADNKRRAVVDRHDTNRNPTACHRAHDDATVDDVVSQQQGHLVDNYMLTSMDKSILKVHLPNGGFNVVKCGDATDIKVGSGDLFRV